uniref:Ig-like domain-containing protein n=1 Tax=Hucho hucho TaxID=62062 RepID=A0A4W5LXI8_9TELE
MFACTKYRYCTGQDVLPHGPVNGTLGGNVIFKTTINPTTLSAIAWTFGDPPVSIADFLSSEGPMTGVGFVGRISLDNSTASLELRKLTLIDSGTYKVNIRKAGVIQVGHTSLIVYEPISGANITTSPNPPIIEGSSVTLTCDAAGSIITREWMKDGQLLSASGNITISEDKSMLSINSVKRTDTGEYRCRVSNPISTANAKHGLIINYGPDGVEINGPTEIVGQKLTLTCSADSNPPASYSWMLNGTEIPGHSPEFTKEKSEYSDSGDYICTATNYVTGIKISVVHKLSVKGLPAGAIVRIVIRVLLVVGGAVGVAVHTSVFYITVVCRKCWLTFHID